MNFSPFAGHFAGAIPAIHQFAASGALAASSGSTSAGTGNGHLDHHQRYSHPHHHAAAAAGSAQSPPLHHHAGHFNQAQLLEKLRAPGGSSLADVGQMNNKYGGHTTTANGNNGNQQIHHYGQYSGQEATAENNGNKHLRVGNSSHSLGLNSMANGAYHLNNGDQNQDLGQVSVIYL